MIWEPRPDPLTARLTNPTTRVPSAAGSPPTAGVPSAARSSPTAGGSRRDRRRRRLAAGLIAYGAVGVLLFVVSVPIILGPLASLGKIAAHRGDAVRWLDLSAEALDDVGRGSGNAGTSLASAAGAARDAASLSVELAASMTLLRDASRVSILGSRPLAGLADGFDQVAGRARGLSSSMTSLAGSLDENTRDLALVATKVAAFRQQVSTLRDALAAPGSVDAAASAAWLVPGMLVLAIWLATPAVVSLVAGAFILSGARRKAHRGVDGTGAGSAGSDPST